MLKMGIVGAGGIARTMAGTISRMDDVECPEMPHSETIEIMRQLDIIAKQFREQE
ncbi:MAG: hypothetical protein IJI11_04615 [Mogibacterium sp.]|nr:hypothetical protein [Mogibacterium sp.]